MGACHWLYIVTRWALYACALHLPRRAFTPWGSVNKWHTPIVYCIGIIIGSGKGLSLGKRQAISWTNVDILPIEIPGTSISEISVKIQLAFKKTYFKMSATLSQWRHNDSVSNYRHLVCLLNHLFRRRSRKTSKLLVTVLDGNTLTKGQ